MYPEVGNKVSCRRESGFVVVFVQTVHERSTIGSFMGTHEIVSVRGCTDKTGNREILCYSEDIELEHTH
jgi:hypothetical protein